jgi:hypothetical protein
MIPLIRRVRVWLMLVFALASLIAPQTLQAQSAQQCFDVPGISDCIRGRFLEYWRDNGGLAVFGYPISPEFREQTPEGQFVVQYFERNVFEYHPENAPPYDVLLGRLGDTRLLQLERDWFAEPKSQPTPGCSWWAQTSHSICGEFKAYWEGHGLNDPALDRTGRSLALFGLPLTEPAIETNAAGDTVLTQWFERARFELHPGKGVLLGLLGNETQAEPQGPPHDLPPPPPATNNACAHIAPPFDAYIEPNCVVQGEDIFIAVFNFPPNEEISYWITQQDGSTIGGSETVRADAEGFFEGIISTADWGMPPGDYVFVAQDSRGQLEPSRAPFRVLPAGGAPAPAPAPAPTPAPSTNCDPAYPTVCIPPPPPDKNCPDIPYRNFPVLPPDPHNFDLDRDGIGCEE